MNHKKHYPERNKLRLQGKRVSYALKALVDMEIEIIKIDFLSDIPLIEVYPSGGIKKLRASDMGHGRSKQGKYIRKAAYLKGCQVEWNEAK